MNEKEEEFELKKPLFEWGGWKNELFWILFFGFLLLMVYGYKKDIGVCKEIAADPCEYCSIFSSKDLGDEDYVDIEDYFNYSLGINITNATIS